MQEYEWHVARSILIFIKKYSSQSLLCLWLTTFSSYAQITM